jgi:predicted dehydrogenase
MGKRHGREFIESSQGMVDVAAVVETSDHKYEEGCKWCSRAPTRYTDMGSFLANARVDGIVISTPNFAHYDMLKQCAGLRTPILLEKPMDADFARICEIVRFEQTYQGPIVVHHVMRYAPIVRKAAALIAAGRIGKICSVNFIQYGDAGMWHSFRRTHAGGGGMLIEKATHDIDVMLNLIDARPVRIAAIARRQAYGGDKPDDLHCRDCEERLTCPESYFEHGYGKDTLDVDVSNDHCVYARAVDIPDNETCLIEFEKDIFGTYSHCFFVHQYFSREYEILGLNGTLRISFTSRERGYKGKIVLAPRNVSDGNHEEYDFDYEGRIHYNGGPGVVRHFIDLMNGAAAPETTVQQAFAAEVIGHAAEIAARKGVFLPVADVVPEDLRTVWNNIRLARSSRISGV